MFATPPAPSAPGAAGTLARIILDLEKVVDARTWHGRMLARIPGVMLAIQVLSILRQLHALVTQFKAGKLAAETLRSALADAALAPAAWPADPAADADAPADPALPRSGIRRDAAAASVAAGRAACASQSAIPAASPDAADPAASVPSSPVVPASPPPSRVPADRPCRQIDAHAYCAPSPTPVSSRCRRRRRRPAFFAAATRLVFARQ